MSRGLPDYKSSGSGYSQAITDVAELAARTGSINLAERKGSVVWYDDCTGGIGDWTKQGINNGATVTWSTYRNYLPNPCIKITPGTVDGQITYITKRVPVVVASKVGFEMMYSQYHDNIHPPANVYVNILWWYNGTNYRYGWLDMCDEQTIRVRTPTGGTYGEVCMSNVAPHWGGNDASVWNYMKLVIDIPRLIYDRFVLNNIGLNLQQYEPVYMAIGQDTRLEIIIYVGSHGYQHPVWITNPIVTIDEP